MDMNPVEALSWAAGVATLYSYFAKTMVPLRCAAMTSNALLIGYGAARGMPVMVGLQLVLLVLNGQRLRAMLKLTRSVQAAATTCDLSLDWLRPYMKSRLYPDGAVMFRKGDLAAEAFTIVSGSVRLDEIGLTIGPGTFFGEMGLFTTDNCRTISARCEGPVEVLFITYDEFRQLYFQQPSFGFYVLRLIVARMEKNVELARQGATTTRSAGSEAAA